MNIQRFKIIVEYDGTTLAGWQLQPGRLSVQTFLEDAGFKICGQKVETYASGRTDAGVHAKGMVAQIDFPEGYSAHTVKNALNFHLHDVGAPVAVLAAEAVSMDFHARFSCIRRHYQYIIENRSPHLVLEFERAWRVVEHLDVERMQRAADLLVGVHDFTSFRAKDCQAKSPIRELEALRVERVGTQVHIYASARSFLHRMVRNMVGTLKLVGDGTWEPEIIHEIFAAKKRAAAGPNASACGLYFIGADYE